MTSRRKSWHPPDYDKTDIRSIQVLAAYASGSSEEPPTPQDCQRALDWIIHKACGTYDEPFHPDNQAVVNYLLGRRSVGLAIVKLMKLKPEIFEDKQ